MKEMAMVLKKDFFARPATEVAPLLVGKILCKREENGVLRARITETECYYGFDDSASHAHKGRTERNSIMFEEGGRLYIYLCYGIHDLLNITTGSEGHPEAVLLRGVEGAQGPGKLTRMLSIDRSLNASSVVNDGATVWIEDDGYVPKIAKSRRIGIDYAKPKDREILWRFYDETLCIGAKNKCEKYNYLL